MTIDPPALRSRRVPPIERAYEHRDTQLARIDLD